MVLITNSYIHPNSNFSGSDTFTYRANDGIVNSNTATVTVDVSEKVEITFPNGGEELIVGNIQYIME